MASRCFAGEAVLAIRELAHPTQDDAYAVWAIGGEKSKHLGYLPSERTAIRDLRDEQLDMPGPAPATLQTMCAGRVYSVGLRALVAEDPLSHRIDWVIQCRAVVICSREVIVLVCAIRLHNIMIFFYLLWRRRMYTRGFVGKSRWSS
jgi:hypothetical protein